MIRYSRMWPTTWPECCVLDSAMELPVDPQRSCSLDLPAPDVPLNARSLPRDSALSLSAPRNWCVMSRSQTPLLKSVSNKLLRKERTSPMKLS